MQFEIHERNLAGLQEKFSKLQKVAKKLDLPSPSFAIIDTVSITKLRSCVEVIEYMHTIEVSGDTPKLAGWEFVSKLEHTPEGNILLTHPNHEATLPEKFRTSSPKLCEHCNTKRVRKFVYVVQHTETGEYKQVGTTCLKDFLGHDNPEKIAAYFEMLAGWIADIQAAKDPLDCSHTGEGSRISREWFLHSVAAMIRAKGWIGSTKAKELNRCSTVGRVMQWLFPPIGYCENEYNHLNVEAEDTQKTTAALEWIEAQDTAQNDYLHNLKAVCSLDGFEPRHYNLAASLFAAYDRAMDNAKKRETIPESNYFGKLRSRMSVTLTVNRIVPIDGDWGTTYLHCFADKDGNQAVWFSSREELEEGTIYTGKATIKEHREYNGAKQTVLTRCKLEKTQCHSIPEELKEKIVSEAQRMQQFISKKQIVGKGA